MVLSIRLQLTALGLSVLAGCASLPDGTIHFAGLSACPASSRTSLETLNADSSTRDLQCGLQAVRDSRDSTLLRSAAGSRIALHLAERNTVQQQREALAREGVRLAEQAVAQKNSQEGEVHYYLAANLGLAVREHPLEAADSLPRLEAEMQKAVSLDPGIDQGGPLRLIGMLYLRAPPWPGGIGDGDKALEYLKQAVEKYPGHPLNHLFYAESLWALEEPAATTQARAEWAEGQKLLEAGNWGYNKAPWQKEFNDLSKSLGEAGS